MTCRPRVREISGQMFRFPDYHADLTRGGVCAGPANQNFTQGNAPAACLSMLLIVLVSGVFIWFHGLASCKLSGIALVAA